MTTTNKNSYHITTFREYKQKEKDTNITLDDITATLSLPQIKSIIFEEETQDSAPKQPSVNKFSTKNNEDIEIEYQNNSALKKKRIKIRRRGPDTIFMPIEKWTGKVQKVEKGYCYAQIQSISDTKLPKEEIIFTIDSLDSDEQRFAQPGRYFYWFIGQEESSKGERRNSSMIRFQRSAKIEKNKFEEIRKFAPTFKATTPKLATELEDDKTRT